MSTSKNYDCCPLKRRIQATLFPKKADIVLGLSGPRLSPTYLEVLPKHKELYLVNYEPKDEAVNANSLVGMFEVLVHNGIYPNFIDADFCKSIICNGLDLAYLYYKCLELRKDIDIAFTFAVRGITLAKTFDWLEKFPLKVEEQTPFNYDFGHRQYAYQYGEVIHYRESGEQMITGIIHISKNSHK